MKINLQKWPFITAIIILGSILTNAQSTTFDFAKRIGGIGDDEGISIAIDGAGNLYSIGTFSGTVDFDPGIGVYNLISAGGSDIFIIKTDASGSFIWAKSIGGANDDIGYTIAVDVSGNIYSSGWFSGTADFDPDTRIANLTSNGVEDIFISKLDNTGNYDWAINIGGTLSDQGVDIKTDRSGNVYLTGIFSSIVDFDSGASTVQLISNGGYDIFILKLNSTGNLVWVAQQGGINDDDATSLGINLVGDVFLCTSFQNTVDFNPGIGINNIKSIGGNDIAITKFNSNGNFIWTKSTGGLYDEKPLAMNLDVSGNIVLTGYFQGTSDFDPSSNISNLTSAGTDDIFVLKLDSTGQFAWAKKIGGTGYDYGNAIATDALGNIYVTGFFSNTISFKTSSVNYLLSSAGQLDICIAILDSSGNNKWAAGFGSSIIEGGRDIVVNAKGEVIVIGGFGETIDFNPDSVIFNLTSKGMGDIFYYKMSQKSTSINETHNSNDFAIFPNPTSDFINIQNSKKDKLQVEIYSSIGEIILSKQIQNPETLSINTLSAGVYFVIIISEDKSITTKKIQIIK